MESRGDILRGRLGRLPVYDYDLRVCVCVRSRECVCLCVCARVRVFVCVSHNSPRCFPSWRIVQFDLPYITCMNIEKCLKWLCEKIALL